MTTALLKYKNVHKIFNQNMVLKNINLTIEPGMVVGLLGKNGAGKTTLLRSALGLIEVDTGEVFTLRENPTQLNAALKSQVGYVPQQAFGYEGFSIREALDLHSSFYSDWDNNLELDWLKRFELNSDDMVENLSIGQRQALALIMAMAYRPKLLILDEPVASLDPIARREFMLDLFDLSLESGSGVIFSTHITSDIERVATHVALVKDGEIKLFNELDELKTSIRKISFSNETAVNLSDFDVLNKQSNAAIISGYQGQDIAGVNHVSTLSLEQLFVELHA
ncbi:ABC transporter ATP-binding protein [Pseudoalteromonas phenolica]|uniref:ABC transporter ATP-binding protein n=1 Tax=Pseudoalteromonas phenolica TaxID=161398 RepID=A0A5S3YPJ7_9GAMM|nr:ABC transporter ATP-binding protein [Pseudoalteromonas phenolica]TMP78402.1 ABC transporter ATP-binding protein [Pseudoalteromonas phenolica]